SGSTQALHQSPTRGVCPRPVHKAYDPASIGTTRTDSFLEVPSARSHAERAGDVNLKKLDHGVPKRRISCPRGPRSHGFCGLTVVQAALNYVARSYLKSEVQQSFIPLSPHSWLRHIGAAMWLAT